MASPAHNLALHPSCLDAGKLTLDYVEHLRVQHVSPDTDVLDVHSLNIARAAGPNGRLQWLGRPGNWVLREGRAATDCSAGCKTGSGTAPEGRQCVEPAIQNRNNPRKIRLFCVAMPSLRLVISRSVLS
ncbi:hypothetical protein GCM10028822_03650 [Hymenobacter terrigena]